MNKRVTSIEETINKKWIPIVEGDGRDNGSANCALCYEYLCSGCIHCPIYKDSGRTNCKGTPYEEWNALFEAGTAKYANTPDRKAAATKMLKYLQSLMERVKNGELQ
jgi:hypothetical protein